jgi:excisionase family DNA binding protein
MEELLTAKQVQEILKVDRTTIYRMLKDRRLTGAKVGNQWRFPVSEVQELLSGGQKLFFEGVSASANILPLRYVQPVQDVFAEMAEVGSVITDCTGMPLTRMSNPCDFCNLILGSEKGKQACRRSWQQLAEQSKMAPEFTTCHAGLQYALARIMVCGETVALLVAGQFYFEEPPTIEREKQFERLGRKYQLDPRLLKLASGSICVLDQGQVTKISRWLSRVAKTFEEISLERADMLSRFHQIAEISFID